MASQLQATGNAFSVLIKPKFWDIKSRCHGEFTRVNASFGVSVILAAGLSLTLLWKALLKLQGIFKSISKCPSTKWNDKLCLRFSFKPWNSMFMASFLSVVYKLKKDGFSIEKRKRPLQNGFFFVVCYFSGPGWSWIGYAVECNFKPPILLSPFPKC